MNADPSRFSDSTFHRDAASALHRLRDALEPLLVGFGGAPFRQAADLRRVLNVGRQASWQLFRLISASDPVAEGQHVPGPAPMKQLLRDATRRGVPADRIGAVRDAYTQYLEVVERHANDRAAFDAMLATTIDATHPPIALAHRRGAFRHQSYIFGKQAKVQLQCTIIAPAAETDAAVDAVLLQGYVDLQHFRWLPFSVHSAVTRGTSESVEAPSETRREPLLPPEELTHGVSLLKVFSSERMPEIRRRSFDEGFDRVDFLPHEIGKLSEFTYMIGDVTRNIGSPLGDEKPELTTHASIGLPIQTLVHDLLIDRTHMSIETVEALSYRRPGPFGRKREPLVTSRETVSHERVVRLEPGLSPLHVPGVPRYEDMVALACERLGWDPERFQALRCHIDFPIVDTRVMIRCGVRKAAP